MNALSVNRRLIVSIFAGMLLVYCVQGISYGQPGPPIVTTGETNMSLAVKFQIKLEEGVDVNTYEIQIRPKPPQGEWITKCVVIERGIRHETGGDADVFASAIYVSGILFHFGDWSDETFNIRAIFTNLEPGTTYEARYRDTNRSKCAQNHPTPDSWSESGEETTHSVTPSRVEFVDVKFATQVRKKLGLSTVGGDIEILKIPQASLENLTELELDDKEITEISGLEYATRLTELDLSYNQISDITTLSQLTQLIYLDLSDNQIINITPLVQLTQLTELELDRNQIRDITPLSQLTPLAKLSLWDNQISDISALAGLPSLKYLSLSSNQISDISVLTTFASIESLRHILLYGNPITDVSPIRKLKREYPNLSISIDTPVNPTDQSGEPDGTMVEPLESRITTLGNIKRTALLQNYPNPFNPETWIPYELANDAVVTLTIYDPAGHIVRTLDVGLQKSGVYRDKASAAYWDGFNHIGEPGTSGAYFYQFSAGDYTALRRMAIVK